MYINRDKVVQVDGVRGARLAVPLQRQQLEERGGRQHFQHVALGQRQPGAAARVQVLHYELEAVSWVANSCCQFL